MKGCYTLLLDTLKIHYKLHAQGEKVTFNFEYSIYTYLLKGGPLKIHYEASWGESYRGRTQNLEKKKKDQLIEIQIIS